MSLEYVICVAVLISGRILSKGPDEDRTRRMGFFHGSHSSYRSQGEKLQEQYDAEADNVLQLVLVNNVLYSAVTNLTKSSIVVQYLRLFSGLWSRRACHVALVLLFAAAMYGIFAGVFICVPVKKFWRPDAHGHCESANTLWLASAGMNIVMDWIVWILPMPVISQLKLPRRQRIGVVAVFMLGGL